MGKKKAKLGWFLYLFALGFLFPSSHAHTGLYKESDPMVLFTNETIMDQLQGKDRVWIVEFYSSWCGHCQAFAPKWLRLAWELSGWNRFVLVGALDCAHEANYGTCRAFGIEAYPTIKFFDIGWQNATKDGKDIGNKYKGDKNIKQIRRALVDHIEEQKEFDKSMLPFDPVGQQMIDDFMASKYSYRYLALVFDSANSYSGKILILDVSGCKKVGVRRVSDTNHELIQKYNVTEYPSLILITYDGSWRELSPNNRTHVGFLDALDKIVPVVKKPKEEDEKKEKEKQKDMEEFKNMTNEVYMMDLVSAVSFSLRREVPKKKEIDGAALDALKDWVNLLLQCLPAERELSKFIALLDQWLNKSEHKDKLLSSQYLNYLETNQEWDSYLPSKIEWRGCKGSEAKYRGFPCSLWQLFHAITVHCADKQSTAGLDGYEILSRIRGFIDHFFGCRYCRNHFVDMAKNLKDEVESKDDAVLWLWERHNRVNARLAKDISTDPMFPKVQFPSEEMCDECRSKTSDDNTIETDPKYGVEKIKWNKRVLLEFLKEHYGPDNIRVRDKVKSMDVEAESSDTVRRPRPRFVYKYYSRTASPGMLAYMGLSRVDTSMCLIIYMAVIGTIVGLYVYFLRRKRSKMWKYSV